jgi:hypothetical protein
MRSSALLSICGVLAFFYTSCSLVVGTGFKQVSSQSNRNIGINLSAAQLDWVEDRLFADAMKTARGWT